MLELPHSHLQNTQCGHPNHCLQYNQYEDKTDEFQSSCVLCENIPDYKTFMYLTDDSFVVP